MEVSYRKVGETAWHDALPLLRLDGERVKSGRQIDVTVPNSSPAAFSTSSPTPTTKRSSCWRIPTACGDAREVVTVRTRAEPTPATDGRIFHVYPHGFTGQKIQPAFEGLLCAYNLSCSGVDYSTTGRPRVRPGDTLLVHAGLYKYNRYDDAGRSSAGPVDGVGAALVVSSEAGGSTVGPTPSQSLASEAFRRAGQTPWQSREEVPEYLLPPRPSDRRRRAEPRRVLTVKRASGIR